jgi:DNA modification methylase
MVPVVQKHIIDIIKQANPRTLNVVDPFMGSATSLVACMQNGLNCYGQDINPLAILIAEARTGPYYVRAVKGKINALFENIITDGSDEIEVSFNGIYKWFKSDTAIELSKIVRAIRKEPRLAIRRFYWVNLAETIRLTSNDRTSTYKLHARPKEEILLRKLSPLKIFKEHLKKSIEDLELYRNLLSEVGQLSKDAYKSDINLSLQDSSKRIITPQGQNNFFDLLVTSPPYGDNKTTVTYGQHSFLPLQWIDLHDIDKKANKDFLKSTLEIDSRSLGGRLRKLTKQEIFFLCSQSPSLKAVHDRLLTTTSERVNKVLVFVQDLYNVLEQIFQVMKPNSYQVWTIGNRTVGGIEIPNNHILKEFIVSKGGLLVTQVEREILNKRMAKRNSNSALMNFEDILIFRNIG